MAVPYMAQTLRGWTTKRTAQLLTKAVIDHLVTESTSEVTLDMNIQPMPAEKINKKPEGQRSWKWWSVIIKEGQLLKTDDIIIIDSVKYKIMSRNDWTESGFQKYEAVEGFQ